MALINIKIFGIKISDTLSFKLIVGGICIVLLLIFLGPNNFYQWTIQSLTTYVATLFIIMSVTNFFINGELRTRDILMMAAGSILLLLSCAGTTNSLSETGIAVIKAFVWATIFSIFIEAGKKHVNNIEHKVKRLVEPNQYGYGREDIIDGNENRMPRDRWDGEIRTHKIEKISRRPYIKQ